MRYNAAIIAWARRAGVRGDGTAALAPLAIRHPLPAETVARGRAAESAGLHEATRRTRRLRVPTAALRTAGITAAIGDRIRVRTTRPALCEHDLAIVGIDDLGWEHEIVELVLDVVEDGQ